MFGRGPIARFLRSDAGTSGVEMVVWTALLVVPIASVTDIGGWIVQDLQVRTASQAGAEAVRKACWSKDPPYTSSCTTMVTVATNAVQQTRLGNTVTVDANYPKEGFYCTNSSDQLTLVGAEGYVGNPAVKPSSFTCASVTSGSTALPGAYVRVKVSRTFTPMFSTISVAGFLPTTITRTAWTRIR